MPQFDVYKNNNHKTKNYFPYLVDIQHHIISDLATRLVIPLSRNTIFSNKIMGKLTPFVWVSEQEYVLLTPQLTSVPTEVLTEYIDSIELQRGLIIQALDFAITGI